MPDNKSITDPVAEIAERALKKTNILTIKGWSGSDQRYLFVAPYDCRIDQVSLLSDTAVQTHDDNYYILQVRNLTQSEALLSTPQRTRPSDAGAIKADEVFDLSPDQNQVIHDGDVLELEVTKVGAAPTLLNAEIIAVVESESRIVSASDTAMAALT